MTPLVIVNPRAGAGRAGREWSRTAVALRESIGPFDGQLTSGPMDAARQATAAVHARRPLVVAVGGDGTVNEVVHGLLSATADAAARPELALIVIGTGADLARSLCLPAGTLAQARRAGQATSRFIDAGRAEFMGEDGQLHVRHFVNVAGLGLSGVTDRVVNAGGWLRVLGARAAFQVGVARALMEWRNEPVTIEVDGTVAFDGACKVTAVANGRWFGGGMRIAPEALLDDGLLDVVVVGDVGALTLVRRLPLVYRGEHLRMPEVQVLRGRVVTARPTGAGPVPLDLDGESPGYLPATFSVVPAAVRVRA